jgi:hypothetical protein
MTLLLTLAMLCATLVHAQDPATHSTPLPHDAGASEAAAPAPEAAPEPAPTPIQEAADAPPTAPVPVAPPTVVATPTPVVIELTQPAPTPQVMAPGSQPPPPANLAANLLPRPPKPDLLRAVLLLLAVMGCVGLANLAERPLRHLAARGMLPSALKLVVVACRSGALLVAFLGLLHLVPRAWSPAVAYVLVGTALAVGWSVREVVQDVLVGLIFILERSFRTGQRLRFEGVTGTLTRMTFRVTWLRTDEGADIAIPNRRLTGATLELDPEPYAPVSVLLLVPPCRSAVEARNTIRELVLLNPYLAPGEDPQVYRQADDPQRWRVKARLLDASYADRFRGTMVDLVEEVFGSPNTTCDHLENP